MNNRTPERRFARSELNISGDERPHLQGYALKFNSPSVDMGGWTEIILPGSIELEDDVYALFDHDESKFLGRTSSGTLKLNIDDVGLAFDLELPDTTAGRDTAELCRRGDITGCSFGFYEIDATWQQTETGMVRALNKICVFEVTPATPSPAYLSTEVALRSLERWRNVTETKPSPWLQQKKLLLGTHEKYFFPNR